MIPRAKVPLKCNFVNKSAHFPQAAPCPFSILGRTLHSQGKSPGWGHVKRVDHGDAFDALLFRKETLTGHYFIVKFDLSWGINTNRGFSHDVTRSRACLVTALIRHFGGQAYLVC